MLTVVVKRSQEPKVIQLTQENIMRDLRMIMGAEMLLEDSWTQGLQKVRTPYVCLVEADCVLSANYLASNFGLMRKTTGKNGKGGGYNKLAMLSSCLGIRDFGNRIYNYQLERGVQRDLGDVQISGDWKVVPNRDKRNMKLYPVQIGFVPGAIIRTPSLAAMPINFDMPNLIDLSVQVSFHFWGTGRRVEINPNTTYVSDEKYLEKDPPLKYKVPDKASALFSREGI